jgi:type IV secretory pathway VirB4 component
MAVAKPKENQKEYNSADFIPLACHYDRNTVITKNGELIKVIKLTGLNIEKIENEKTENIRFYIRKALSDSIKSANVAVWIHTIRRRKDITLPPIQTPLSAIASKIADKNIKYFDYSRIFVNEVYITIAIQPFTIKEKGLRGFFSSLYYPYEFENRFSEMAKANQELTEISDTILKHLSRFGAEVLTVKKSVDDGVFYSLISGFFSKIVNFQENNFPLAFTDLSQVLASYKFRIGFNYIEFFNEEERHFVGILTLKEYHEISAKKLEEIFNLPIKFIAYETFDFSEKADVKDNFVQKYEYMQSSGANEIAFKSGLYDIMEAEKQDLHFGEHQMCFCVINDDKKLLEEDITTLIKKFQDLGLVMIREDLFVEECYWGSVPGNFPFLRRRSPTTFEKLGGFAILSNVAIGKKENNLWGEAVVILRTENNVPYYFNFHDGANGNTFVVGRLGSGKTLLVNYLLLKAMKFNINLIYFDATGSSELFISALGGKYIKFNDGAITDNYNNNYEPANFKKAMLSEKIFGINLGTIKEKNDVSRVVMSFLKDSSFVKNRTIIVLDGVWKDIDDAKFKERVGEWLSFLTERNSMAIFITDTVDDAINNELEYKISKDVATKLFFANPNASENYKRLFGVEDAELDKINSIKTNHRVFVVKNGENAYPISSDIPFLNKDDTEILSCNPVAIKKYQDKASKNGLSLGEFLTTHLE